MDVAHREGNAQCALGHCKPCAFKLPIRKEAVLMGWKAPRNTESAQSCICSRCISRSEGMGTLLPSSPWLPLLALKWALGCHINKLTPLPSLQDFIDYGRLFTTLHKSIIRVNASALVSNTVLLERNSSFTSNHYKVCVALGPSP